MANVVKTEIIKKYARKDGDTGSPEVQIALFTQRIKALTEHLKLNRKDHSTRRGLLALVSNRKSLLKYLSKENFELYVKLSNDLEIRRK
jgi:small subunit ribosomal protein S15